MRFLKPAEVVFAEDKVEEAFNNLKDSDEIKKYIRRAIEDKKSHRRDKTKRILWNSHTKKTFS